MRQITRLPQKYKCKTDDLKILCPRLLLATDEHGFSLIFFYAVEIVSFKKTLEPVSIRGNQWLKILHRFLEKLIAYLTALRTFAQRWVENKARVSYIARHKPGNDDQRRNRHE
ncbi:hypothetical protein EDS67_22005 [candidate division KSB1 bacterium]|nr:MAG: hypothetical protein EDS67_22005 [candidate division KSB1 bacterium]MBC6949480.1 hypothetical protein [candidate division KSB1 bacterium]MCE7944461.1 hypothetical protein [Chlorobi bacterium CHB1]